MRYIMVLIWSILISAAISYVLTSMAGELFNLTHVFILAGIFFVAIILLTEGILQEKEV